MPISDQHVCVVKKKTNKTKKKFHIYKGCRQWFLMKIPQKSLVEYFNQLVDPHHSSLSHL